MRKVFQPLLWALVGAGIAGGVFFLLNRPQGAAVTIVVPTPTSPGPASVAGNSATPERQLININLATAEQLDGLPLPGFGLGKAQAIIDYRNKNGPFQRIDELMKVPGIGPTIYQGLKDLVTVGEAP